MNRNCLATLFLMSALASWGAYTTPNHGTTYTLASLASTEGSGVTEVGNSTWLLSDELTIAENDKLKLNAGETLKIKDGVMVNIDGEALFNPADKAYIEPETSEALPKGFRISGKTTMENLDVQGGTVLYLGTEPLLIKNCDFHNINGEQSLYGVILISGGQSSGNVIENCTFTDCVPGAINTPANMGVELLISGCTITNVSTSDGLRPFINITSCPDKEVIVRNNVVKGAKLEKPGGIGISNMLNMEGANKVTIEGNTVEDCSWGINLVGGMDVIMKNNTVKNCRWDPTDNGGIAATLYSIANYPMKVMATGNTFENNKWGPCVVGATIANFGKTETDDNGEANEGNNVFINNHFTNTSGQEVMCDFCNNTQVTAYAQNCVWNNATTPEEAALYIQDVNTNPAYGTVVYDPIKQPSVGIKGVSLDFDNKFSGKVSLYRLDGVKVYEGDASGIYTAGQGLYIVEQNGRTSKVLVK